MINSIRQLDKSDNDKKTVIDDDGRDQKWWRWRSQYALVKVAAITIHAKVINSAKLTGSLAGNQRFHSAIK